MLHVQFVLCAEVFQQVLVRNYPRFLSVGDGLRVCLGVVNRHFNFESTDITAVKAFDHVQGIAVRVTEAVEPASVIEADRIDDEGVAVPLAGRITHPPRLWILNRVTIVEKNLAKDRVLLVENPDQSRCLDNFVRKGA